MTSSLKRAIAATVIGLGVTGGVVLADTATTTPASGTTTPTATTAVTATATNTTAATTNQTVTGTPAGQARQGQGGPPGQGPGGRGGPGGPGMGQPPGPPTTASVTTEISNLTQAITSVKADRDFANGKMDLTTVNSLIDKASALQTQAQSSLTANNLTQAGGYARAADDAVHSADDLIIASIGTTGLPSAANRPAPPANAPSGAQATPTADQQKARSSNDLARSYQSIVDTTNRVKASNNAAGDLSYYVTTGQGLYKQAYDLYNAGKYDQASQTARAASGVVRIADDILRAAGVTPTGPQVVPVPAPNF